MATPGYRGRRAGPDTGHLGHLYVMGPIEAEKIYQDFRFYYE